MTGFEDAKHHNRGVLETGVKVLLKPIDKPTVVQTLASLDADATENRRRLRAAIDAFLRTFDIQIGWARRMLETIVDGYSPKDTRTEDGKPLPRWTIDKTRAEILAKSRLQSTDAVIRWIYRHAWHTS